MNQIKAFEELLKDIKLGPEDKEAVRELVESAKEGTAGDDSFERIK